MISTDERDLRLCVEISTDEPRWLEDVPPTPAGATVTVSFGAAWLAARDQATIGELGYHSVGTAAVGHAEAVAHLLVPLALATRHPRWWRAVLDAADRVYDLRFGPVQVALHAVIAAHDPTPDSRPPVRAQRRPGA